MEEHDFSGTIEMGMETQPFRRTVEGHSTEHARDKLLGELGSEHGVPRTRIHVEEETE
jgi:ribosomal protein L20A (L18A)